MHHRVIQVIYRTPTETATLSRLEASAEESQAMMKMKIEELMLLLVDG
jgi:hypothetical protein